jgi:hypothetical protein
MSFLFFVCLYICFPSFRSLFFLRFSSPVSQQAFWTKSLLIFRRLSDSIIYFSCVFVLKLILVSTVEEIARISGNKYQTYCFILKPCLYSRLTHCVVSLLDFTYSRNVRCFPINSLLRLIQV